MPDTYNTVNGERTPDQMAQELKNVGWGGNPNDVASVVNAYATTTRGSVTTQGGLWPGGGGGPSRGAKDPSQGSDPSGSNKQLLGGDTGAQQWAAQMALDNAQKVAYQKYLDAKLKLETDQEAFAEAQQAFTNEITKAGLTGMYQGAPTQAALQYGANTFGTWGAPQQGQQTLAAQQQQFAQQQALAEQYGQAYGTYGAVPQGQQTLAAQQQAYNQWLQGQQQALAQWQAQQGAAQNYLQMMANLRGPADWAQYQKVLGATPGGMTDLVRAAAGQYIPGGGATTGVQPQAASLQSFVGGLGQPDASAQAAQQSLVAPNQMAPQTWNALQPSQKQMLLGIWEGQGYDKNDAQNLFTQSLPKYGSMSPTAGTFRLQG